MEKIKEIQDLITNIDHSSSSKMEDISNIKYEVDISSIDIGNFFVYEYKALPLGVVRAFSYKLINNDTKSFIHFNFEEKDFVLKEINQGSLCEQHSVYFEELLEEEERQFEIDPYQRFKLYQDVSACEECSQTFSIECHVIKDKLLEWFQQDVLQKDFSQNIRVWLWSTTETLEKEFAPFDFLKREPKPHLFIIGTGNKVDVDGFIQVISLNISDFKNQVESSLSNLEKKYEELKTLNEKQSIVPQRANNHLWFIPPEYWFSANTKEVEKLSEIKSALFKLPQLLFVSMVWSISDTVSCIQYGETLTITFTLEKDIIEEFSLEIAGNEVLQNSKPIQVSSEKELIRFYEEMLYSKYTKTNLKIVKDTIILASDEGYLSILNNPKKLLRYYRFHYENLLEEKAKERSEVIKTFINSSQSLKAKLIDDVGDVTKNVINILTVLLGLLLSFAIIYGRSADAGWDFAFLVISMFSILYIPINTVRLISIMDLANSKITSFYTDIKILKRVYKYDFEEIVNVKTENLLAEKKLKKVILIVFITFTMMQIAMAVGDIFLVKDYYQQLFIEKYLDQKVFYWIYGVVLGLIIVVSITRFVKHYRVVPAHRAIEKQSKAKE